MLIKLNVVVLLSSQILANLFGLNLSHVASQGLEPTDVWSTMGISPPSGFENSISSFPNLDPSDNQYTSEMNLNTLRFVAVVSRHGSRTPLWTYPGDPTPYTNITLWPDGQEHMTRFGKQQMYLAGQRLRAAYDGFISQNYFPNETRVECYRLPRDFETASTAMAGLYPPLAFQLWNPAILWNPIYIETIDDHLYKMIEDKKNCPRYLEEAGHAVSRIDMRPFRDVSTAVSQVAGSRFTDSLSIATIYDTITMANENGYGIPYWSQSVYPEPMKEVHARVFDAVFSGSPTIIRLVAGPTLAKIGHLLEAKATGHLHLRMYYLAAHDADVRALLAALGSAIPRYVDTSAFVTLEMHETAQGLYVTALYYRDSSALSPERLPLPDCGDPCSLANFLNITSTQSADRASDCRSSSSLNL